MDLHLRRPTSDDDFVAWWQQMRLGFFGPGQHPSNARSATVLDRDRLRLVTTDDGEVVGTIAAIAMEVAVHGARVPAGASCMGTTRTDMTGRGAFRQMITELEDDALAAGEPLLITCTPHGGLFGRFGYGPAWSSVDLEIPRRDLASVRGDRHRVTHVDRPTARAAFPTIHAEAMSQRAGGLLRPSAMWDVWLHDDPDADAVDGWSRLQTAHVPGEGYVVFRVRVDHAQWRNDALVEVVELVATTADATAALWSHVAAVDAADTVRAPRRPVDDALPHLLRDRYALDVHEGAPMWLRIADLGAAWRTCPREAQGEVLVEVHDEVRPDNAGVWRLAVTDEGPTADRVDATPGLELDTQHLAAAWFGGVGVGALAAAGHVRAQDPAAVVMLDRLLRGTRAPWASYRY